LRSHGRMPRSKTADALDRAELSNYSNLCRSSKFLQTIFAAPFLAHLLTFSHPRELAARHAVHDRQHAAICAKPVWDLAIVTYVKRRQIGVLARFHAAFTIGQSKRPGSVDVAAAIASAGDIFICVQPATLPLAC